MPFKVKRLPASTIVSGIRTPDFSPARAGANIATVRIKATAIRMAHLRLLIRWQQEPRLGISGSFAQSVHADFTPALSGNRMFAGQPAIERAAL
ncbi:MAG: hypothetical protein JNL83_11130 [Myxococcales bacterium]|nr:hypothetical protein [Myxococcales bacterium]